MLGPALDVNGGVTSGHWYVSACNSRLDRLCLRFEQLIGTVTLALIRHSSQAKLGIDVQIVAQLRQRILYQTFRGAQDAGVRPQKNIVRTMMSPDGICSVAMPDLRSNRRNNRQIGQLAPFTAMVDRCQISALEK